ncbi:hypothetical protein GJU94_13130 [Brucella sp. 10RB9214]|uniref:terminase small subunit n=1 Tax=unclassified Brucella TaxID=2632610 RepID=UPI0009727AC9|nr:terminase small subunit [Brucella sp. 09RB8910]APY15824.1 hypothetical protein BKD02_16365 [Brucella sp. 09RB8910]MRN48090.1 hypothetical protein [Brucella sp. 10RB9212]MRN50764.1 hypothetical protein [Brucella sp. 10RB9214]
MSLTPKQEAFARAYVETGNASEAYRRAYNVGDKTKPESVWVKASELLANGKVSVILRNAVISVEPVKNERRLSQPNSLN